MPSPEELLADAFEELPEASSGLNVLVERMVVLKSQLDALEVARKEIQADYDGLRKRLLPQVLGDQGWTNVKTPLGTLSIHHKSRASVPANRRDECREWLNAHCFAHMLTLEPAAALTVANALIGDGLPVPDFIRMYTEETAVLTRKKE